MSKGAEMQTSPADVTQRGLEPDTGKIGRVERVGTAWRVNDDALWNPFEAAAYVLAIMLGFGFLLGGGVYAFAFKLFLPEALLVLLVVLVQAALRWRNGEMGAISMMRERIR